MKKLIILAQDRLFAQRAINIIKEAHQEGRMQLSAIVSEHSYYEKFIEVIQDDVVWINNRNKNENKIIEIIRKENIDIVLSLQHKWIISKNIIDAVNGYAFNIHFGKLPDYRGHHIYIHAILNSESSVTTTLHWMDPKVDFGDIISEIRTLIKPDDTSWSLWFKTLNEAIKLLNKLIEYITNNVEPPKITVKGKGHFYSINSIVGLKEISSIEKFNEVNRKSRAFYYPPHEPAYFISDGKKYYVIPEPVYHESVI